MKTDYILEFSEWLEGLLPQYIDYLNDRGTRQEIDVKAFQGESSGKVWGSALDGCPKEHAATRRKLIKKIWEPKMLYRFEIANRAADLAKEAIEWGCIERKDENGTTYDSGQETRIGQHDKDQVSGYIDSLIIKHHPSGFAQYMPVEIKHTSADKHAGLTPSMVWQLIAYMYAVAAPAGFLYCLYDFNSKMGTHKVWPVKWDDGSAIGEASGWYLLDTNGQPAHLEGDEWPNTPTGITFFNESEYWNRLEKHADYYAMEDKVIESKPPYSAMNWRCAYVNASGRVYPNCPLYAQCWGNQTDEN